MSDPIAIFLPPLPPGGVPPPAATSGPVARKAFNLVTFTPDDDGTVVVYLNVESDWVRKCGIAPDVNQATVSYLEFLKLNGNVNRTGKINLWYNSQPGGVVNVNPTGGDTFTAGAPDVTLSGEQIADVEMIQQREIPGGKIITTEYRIYFTDFRCQYVAPFGGRLETGLINSGLPPDGNSTLFEDPTAADPQAVEMSLSELIFLCLGQMNIHATLPDGVDSIAAPRDLKWFGNHAPSELKKLLSLCGCAFVPELEGFASIQAITADGSPTLPAGEGLTEQSAPQAERRGKVVVFSSYPRRVLQTQTIEGPNPITFFFVCQDSKDRWVPIEQCDLLNNISDAGRALPGAPKGVIDPVAAVKQQFANVPEKFRGRVRSQLYKCIRASANPPVSLSPILTRRFEADRDYPIQVLAATIVGDPANNGLFANASVPIEIPVLHILDGNILQLGRMLGTIAGGPTASPHAHFIDGCPFTVRFTAELAIKDAKSRNGWHPQYFHCGFARDGAGTGVTPMSPGDVENAIDGGNKDAIILTRPSWRLLNVDGQDVNRDALVALAQAEAANYLLQAAKPARIASARGFAKIAPSGLVTEVRWSQSRLQTTAMIGNWYTPLGALTENTELRKMEGRSEEGVSAYPAQPATESSKGSLGEAGEFGPVAPVDVAPDPIIAPGPRLVKVPDTFAGGGFYTVLDVTGAAQNMGAHALAGGDLLMPEGMNVASTDTKAIGVNLPESGQSTHLIPLNSFQIAFPLGQYTDAKGHATDVLAMIAQGEVDLQIVGAAARESGTYQIVIPNGAVSGEDPTSAQFAMPASGQTIPKLGRQAYGQNLAEQGLAAGSHMLEVDGSVWARGAFVGFAKDGLPVYHFTREFSPFVDVYSDGGSDGDAGATPTQNTWTYTVFDRTGSIPIATGLTPTWARQYGPATTGTHGMIRIAAGAVVELQDVDDVIKPGSCPSGGE